MTSSDVAAYLGRIGYRGDRTPTETSLRDLHLAHLFAVPFENLDISRGVPIQLDPAALFAKIVTRRRGGFCYELNGLFAELLGTLGFEVTLLSAGVAREDGGFGPDFDHLTLRVDLATPWLVDVGFGESFREPLRLETEEMQTQPQGSYRIVADGSHRLLARIGGDGESPQYRFGLEPRALSDFAGMCHYHQTSPSSHFTQKRVCTLATPEGRVTLSERRLIVTRDGTREERELDDEEAVTSALSTCFGVRLDGDGMKKVPKSKEIEERITMEIVVDAYGPEEQALGWYYYLESNLRFPFRARCVAKRTISPLRVGEEVEVVGMPPEEECEDNMFVLINWQGRSLGVPLAQLEGIEVDAETRQAIGDWHYWVARGYTF